MIEKMSFINIIGPKEKIDDISNKYISKYSIHLENALSELSTTTQTLVPFDDANPYKEQLLKLNKFLPFIQDIKNISEIDMSYEEATEFLRITNHDFKESEIKKNKILEEIEKETEKLNQISNFKSLDFDIDKLLNYKYIKFRFGKIPKDYYHKLEKLFYDNDNVIFITGDSDFSYVYGIYFTTKQNLHEVDAIFASLHFETIYIHDVYTGTPRKACMELEEKIANLNEQIEEIDKVNSDYFIKEASKLKACEILFNKLNSSFNIRKLAALTNKQSHPYFILCGWMSKEEALKLKNDIENEEDTKLIIENDKDTLLSKPPTKLKNPWIFKPFEMFVKMYGLPAYDEIDPTWFVAITYAFIFGIMFGDVGQGLCLVLGGFLIYKIKKVPLAAIIGTAGIFSCIFGFMFGSIFGFEDIIKPIWIKPISAMTKAKFVGTLNTIFIVTIAFGMFLVIVSMILHIINGIKSGEKESALFDPNGIAGLIFYGSIILTIVLFMLGKKVPGTILLIILLGLPIIAIIFKEPLGNLIEKKKKVMPDNLGMFFTQSFFEIFEMLLSYFSNTLSFVRIGAFAVSHAAMMEVVLMLAGTEKGGGNLLVIILGNIFVCGMEGLIVGIQVLRLEYYEMFSRFYKGNGRQFKPYKINNK